MTLSCEYCNDWESKNYEGKKASITIEQAEQDYYDHLKDCEKYIQHVRENELTEKIYSVFSQPQADILIQVIAMIKDG